MALYAKSLDVQTRCDGVFSFLQGLEQDPGWILGREGPELNSDQSPAPLAVQIQIQMLSWALLPSLHLAVLDLG